MEEGPVGIPFPEHSADLLGSLNRQRLSGLLCDVLLVAQEREFPAHRSVLASCSTYFHELFTSGLAADRQKVYELDFVRPETLAALLDFAYTATLTVSRNSVVDILSAARVLEISPVQEVCTHLLDTKVLSPPVTYNFDFKTFGNKLCCGKYHFFLQAGSEQEDEEVEERGKNGKEQGIRLRAREYLEFFQRGAHWGSSCSTPELRDLPAHLHFSQRNGADSNGTPTGPADYYSPLAQALAQPHRNAEHDDDEERQNGGLVLARGKGAEALMSFYAPTQNGHFYLHQAEPKSEREVDVAGEREQGSATALLQQMMEQKREQAMAGGGEKDRPESEEPDVEFYLKYFSTQQEEVNSAPMSPSLLPLWSTRSSGGGNQASGAGNSGEKKMRSKAYQKCPICSKVIQGAGKLPRHIRTHTGEKPYECTICKVRFTR